MCRHVRFWTGFLSVGIGMLLVMGCAAGTAPKAKVHGSATLDDKPIPFGIISFNPTEVTGSPAQGYVRNGEYTINEINFGKYKVNLTAESEAPAEVAQAGEATSDMMQALKKGKSPADVGAKMAKRGRGGSANDPNAIENSIRRAKGMGDNIMPPNAAGNDKEVDVVEKDQTIDFKIMSPGKKK